jgi:mannitol-1-/sugar-/sorbitol-6-phosphatase
MEGFESLPARIEALLYDFDDTIVKSERLNDLLFADVLSSVYSVSLTNDDRDLLYGLSWTGVFDWLREHRSLPATRPEVWAHFLAAKERLLSTRLLPVASGIEVMLSLPARHAIVSGSTRAEIGMMMKNIGMLPDAVSFIICDEDCAKGKPDPVGFRLALQRLGVRPENAIVFEDSPVGLMAARAAGITAVFISELASRDNAAYADLSFATFGEAAEAIRPRVVQRSAPERGSTG